MGPGEEWVNSAKHEGEQGKTRLSQIKEKRNVNPHWITGWRKIAAAHRPHRKRRLQRAFTRAQNHLKWHHWRSQRKCSTFDHLNLEISAATVFLLMWFSVDLTSNSQESGCVWSELVLYLDCSWCADCILSRKSQKIEDSMFKIFFVHRLIDEHCHVSFTLKGLGSPLTKIQRIFGHNRVNKGEGNSVLYANMLPPWLCSPQGLFALS